MPVWVICRDGKDRYCRLIEVNAFYVVNDEGSWKMRAYSPDTGLYDLARFSSFEAAEKELVSIASAINSGFNVIRIKGEDQEAKGE